MFVCPGLSPFNRRALAITVERTNSYCAQRCSHPCACYSTQREGAQFGTYPPPLYLPACHGSSTPPRHRSPNKHPPRTGRYPLSHLAFPSRCKPSTRNWSNPHTSNLPNYSCATLSHNQLALHFRCPLREVAANVAAHTPVKAFLTPETYGIGLSWRKCDWL